MAQDVTNQADLHSWLDSANRTGADFPIQNLPIGVFRRRGTAEAFRGGIAIGDQVLDLAALSSIDAEPAVTAAAQPTLNALMRLGPEVWSALRRTVFAGLLEGSPTRGAFERCLVAQAQAEYAVPADIGDYTDFYSSIHHATAVGRLFRPDNPLMPNYKWMPIGYHGRSSSIGVSDQLFHRPRGQRLAPGASQPEVGPSTRMDYELELGVFVGAGNAAGSPIAVADAEAHVFGLCVLNDWSARDLQAWEYQPLGPFLGKNFATTISPWIVPLQALAPFRTAYGRGSAEPKPPDYLWSANNDEAGGFDIQIEALIQTEVMQARREAPQRLSRSSFRHAYWTVAQMIAHHTINGCNLRAGDLLGTGTQSGPTAAEAGSLLELSDGGKRPLILSSGEQRTFLQDGDTIILRAWCERPGAVRIGFGEARGRILPSSF